MKTWQLIAIAIVIGLSLLLFVKPGTRDIEQAQRSDYPWGVDVLPDGGSRVFGLTLGTATLADADRRFARQASVAVFQSPQQRLSLEAYYDEVTLGGLSAKIVLTLGSDAGHLAALRERATRGKPTESGAVQYRLSPDDLDAVRGFPITTLTYIPYIDLDEAIVLHRFGTPARRVRTGAQVEHFLYPAIGLDLVMGQGGKDVLQYVAPRDFAELTAPLAGASKP